MIYLLTSSGAFYQLPSSGAFYHPMVQKVKKVVRHTNSFTRYSAKLFKISDEPNINRDKGVHIYLTALSEELIFFTTLANRLLWKLKCRVVCLYLIKRTCNKIQLRTLEAIMSTSIVSQTDAISTWKKRSLA